MNIHIRRAELNDLPILRDLAERTFREAWQAQNHPEHFEDYCREHFALERLAAEMAQPEAEFHLVLWDYTPAAYMKLNIGQLPGASANIEQPLWPGKPVQIERIYVDASWQGQGIGERLLAFAEARARQVGANWLWLSVWKEAPRAVRFYEKNGFHIFGTEIFWVGADPQPDWIMRKPLL
ncbi:MAG: GNAT family N-acetyltransferase [Saprospiraceae bacterium]|nr:GNAT family N-acetyltransferase [Saprospiraceae bacterium]MDW8230779.1 GNAT family N-acetyltransferase [Saprospiraceae bacterium]